HCSSATNRLARHTCSWRCDASVRTTERRERAPGVPLMTDGMWTPPAADTSLDSRAATFENPTGARGAGGAAHGGRKGAPSRVLDVGESVVLADLEAPGL